MIALIAGRRVDEEGFGSRLFGGPKCPSGGSEFNFAGITSSILESPWLPTAGVIAGTTRAHYVA
jgi:hypothetical protein